MATSKQRQRFLVDFDWWLLLAALGLAGLGVVAIYSSQPQEDYWRRQIYWLVLGMTAMVITAVIDYRRLIEAAPFIYGGCLVLLILVLFIGQENYGTKAWLGVGGFGIQPSELAKIATVLVLAPYLAGRWEEHKKTKNPHLTMRDVIVAAAIVLVPVGLIMLEPDTGTAMAFFPMLIGMLFIAGLRPRVIVLGMVGLAVALSVGWYFRHDVLKDYQVQRIETLLHPERADRRGFGYQTYQSMIAVGSGGVAGRGLFKGTQSRLKFLPKAYTDFIASVVAEELGFVGMGILLTFYLFILMRSINHAKLARDQLGALLIIGVVSLLGFHIVMNIGMVVGLMPIVGIPLPLMSYGGSFILATFVGLGLIANVRLHRYVN